MRVIHLLVRQLKVFRPFFISVDLPYAVIRGEIVAVQVVVFNYMNKDLTAEVLLTNEGQFDFAEVSNEVHDTPSECGVSCDVIKQVILH